MNAAVTSCPFSDSVTFFSCRLLGTCTSTSASPPLMRSARFDSVTISKLRGVDSADLTRTALNRQAERSRTGILIVEPPLVEGGKGPLTASTPGHGQGRHGGGPSHTARFRNVPAAHSKRVSRAQGSSSAPSRAARHPPRAGKEFARLALAESESAGERVKLN